MTYPTTASEQTYIEVTGGVDTHKDTHTAAALDASGRLLGHREFAATAAGYAALLAWLGTLGQLVLVEVDRPDRKTRRWQGKSDPVDAEAAARAALAGRASGVPKTRGGKVDALRALRVARRSAVAARADAQRQIKALIVTAPDALRVTLGGLGDRELIAYCATRRPDRAAAGDPTVATMFALRALARRHQQLSVEIDELDALIGPLVTAINPTLIGLSGVGTDVAGQLLVTAGAHRHRLNRGGDRQANAALYRIVLCRLRWDPRTRAYAQRRTTEGMSKPEIIRCLKRYLAREIYTALLDPQPSSVPAITSTAPEASTWSARSAARTNDVDTDKR